MDLKHYLKKGFDLILLKGEAAEEIARDERAFGPGLLIALIAFFCLAIGKYLVEPIPFLSVLIAPIGYLILFTAGIFVIHIIALLFGGQGSLVALHRAASVAAVLGWTMLIPKVGWVPMVWYVPMLWRILEKTHSLKRSHAVRSTLLSFAIVLNFYLVVLGLQACSSEWLWGGSRGTMVVPVLPSQQQK